MVVFGVFTAFNSSFATVTNLNNMLADMVISTIFAMGMGIAFAVGRNLQFIGSNLSASEYTGIDIRNLTLLAFVLAGALADVGGVLFAARAGTVKINSVDSYLLDTITIAVLSKVLFAGKYKTIGIIAVAFLISMIGTDIVTGAAQGIGKTLASAIAEMGADVAIVDMNLELATATAKEIADKTGCLVKAYSCNITDQESVDAMMAAYLADYGTFLIARAAAKVMIKRVYFTTAHSLRCVRISCGVVAVSTASALAICSPIWSQHWTKCTQSGCPNCRKSAVWATQLT